MALPINEIRHLQLPVTKKLLLGGLFSLGSFVVACTIVRMVSVSPQTTAADQICMLWTTKQFKVPMLTDSPDYQAISNSWTFVETNVGIICACESFHSDFAGPSFVFSSPIMPSIVVGVIYFDLDSVLTFLLFQVYQSFVSRLPSSFNVFVRHQRRPLFLALSQTAILH